MNFDSILVFHCAPTLAGLKMAGLVCIPVNEDQEEFETMVARYNRRYNLRGLYLKVLCTCKGRKLLYVYRKGEVEAYLAKPPVREFLDRMGYAGRNLQEALAFVAERITGEREFPHELGLFLGYPLDDVRAFIHHRGQHALLCGEWKVYSNVRFAEREFLKYKKCRTCYMDMFNRGFSMDRLIIA